MKKRRKWRIFNMAEMSLIERALLFYGATLPDHPRKWWLHEKLRKLLKVQVSAYHDVVRNNLHWRLNPSDFTDNRLFWLGIRDPWEMIQLRKLIRPGSVILDVGANFGYHSLMMASVLKGKTRIIALEPNPANFQRLTYHVNLNAMSHVIEPRQLGVSNAEGIGHMSQNPENSGHAMMTSDGDAMNIPLTTLDIFCQNNPLGRLDLLILDVEGFEERALIGAEKTLAQFKPLILIELFPPVMEKQGSSPEKVRDILTASGYKLFTTHKEKLRPLTELPTQQSGVYAFCFHIDKIPIDLLNEP